MYKRNIRIGVRAEGGESLVRVLTPAVIRFSPNGDVCGMKAIDEARGETVELEARDIEWVEQREGADRQGPQILSEFDVPAEEVDTGVAIEPERRRALLRTRSNEMWRTLGRHLGHVPSDAFRIVYSHGLNQRRIKDVWFVVYRPSRDAVTIRDITNRRKQDIPVPLLLTIVDPRSGEALEREEDVRAFVRRFAPRSLLSAVLRPRRVPQID